MLSPQSSFLFFLVPGSDIILYRAMATPLVLAAEEVRCPVQFLKALVIHPRSGAASTMSPTPLSHALQRSACTPAPPPPSTALCVVRTAGSRSRCPPPYRTAVLGALLPDLLHVFAPLVLAAILGGVSQSKPRSVLTVRGTPTCVRHRRCSGCRSAIGRSRPATFSGLARSRSPRTRLLLGRPLSPGRSASGRWR